MNTYAATFQFVVVSFLFFSPKHFLLCAVVLGEKRGGECGRMCARGGGEKKRKKISGRKEKETLSCLSGVVQEPKCGAVTFFLALDTPRLTGYVCMYVALFLPCTNCLSLSLPETSQCVHAVLCACTSTYPVFQSCHC